MHISISNEILSIIPDVMKDICSIAHSLQFAFDFYKSKPTIISRSYLLHMIADGYAHVNASIIQGAKNLTYYRLTQIVTDSLSSDMIPQQQLEYNFTQIQKEIHEFIQNSNYKSQCIYSEKQLLRKLKQFITEVRLEYVADTIGDSVIDWLLLQQLHGGQCGYVTIEQAFKMMEYETNYAKTGSFKLLKLAIESNYFKDFEPLYKDDLNSFIDSVNGSICTKK